MTWFSSLREVVKLPERTGHNTNALGTTPARPPPHCIANLFEDGTLDFRAFYGMLGATCQVKK